MSTGLKSVQSDISTTYYRALPSYPGIIDLIEVFGQKPLAQLFISALLEKRSISEELVLSGVPLEKMKKLYFSAKNHERRYGTKTLGIGYPTIVFFRNTQIVVAPLYLWSVQIEPVFNAPSKWKISYKNIYPTKLNPYLQQYWQNYLKWDFKRIKQDFYPKGGKINTILNKLIEALGAELDLQILDHHKNIRSTPQMIELDSNQTKPSLYWSATLGAFPPIYSYMPLRINALRPQKQEPAFQPFGMKLMPPSYATILQQINTTNIAVADCSVDDQIEISLQVLASFLSNGKTVLVTGKNYALLEQLQEKIEIHQLTAISILIRHFAVDWPILRQVILNASAKQSNNDFNNRNFESTQAILKKEKEKLDKIYSTIRQELYKGNNLAETVGLYLHNQLKEGKELLGSQLNAQEFEFITAENEEILKIIPICYQLFKKVKTLNHPLKILHDNNFSFPNQEEALLSIRHKVEEAEVAFTQIHHKYIALINEYTDALHRHYEDYYLSLRKKLTTIVEQKAFYTSEYGTDFELTTVASLKIYSNFSTRFKLMLQAKEEIINNHQALIKEFTQQPYFDFSFQKPSEKRNLKKWEEDLKGFDEALENWYEQIELQIRQEVLRLSPSNFNEKVIKGKEVQASEVLLNEQIATLNLLEVFKDEFKNVMLTSVKQQQYIESIIEQIEQAKVFLEDFEAYYNWRKYWMYLNPMAQKVIKALTKVKPNDWLAAYNSWFFYHKIRLNTNEFWPNELFSSQTYLEQIEKLQLSLPAQIKKLWQIKGDRALKNWKIRNKKTHNNLLKEEYSGDIAAEQLLNWISQSLNWITQVVPVMIAPPHTLQELPLENNHEFDLAIFLNADQFDLYEAQGGLNRGAKVLVLGQQEKGILNPHSNPLWNRINKAAINVVPKRKELALLYPEDSGISKGEKTIYYHEVGGRYDEHKGINQAEANATIEVLNKVEETPHRTYPKVGIITFTSGQRDLIYSYFLDIKQRRQAGYEKLQQLERNGLLVLSIFEYDANAFDIIIINNTLSTIDLKGNMTSHEQLFHQKTFNLQLRSLLNQTKGSIFMLNSIPDELFIASSNNTSPFLSLLAFVKNKSMTSNSITDHFDNFFPNVKALINDLSRKLYFVQEVYALTKPLLKTHRLEVYQENNVLSPILKVINESNAAFIAIITIDGFLANTSATSYQWEDKQLKKLLEKDIQVIQIWSINWWKNYKDAARQLAEQINLL